MNALELCRSADAAESAAQADFFAAAPPSLAAAVGLRTEVLHGATLLLAPGLPSPLFNRVIGVGTFEPATEEVLDALVDRYRLAGVRQFWITVSPAARPSTLDEWLAARGFVPPARRSWVQMHWGTAPAPDVETSLEIEPAAIAEAGALASVMTTAFGMPAVVGPWIESVVGRPGWQGYVARDGGKVVGGAFVHVRPPAAWLGLGSILDGFRGRNGQLALLSARIAHARSQGCRIMHTETGEPVGDERNPSLANMIRCGFARVGSRRNHALTLSG